MQKMIKKVIAGAVAALMITSAMPFTALAAPGDYEPDVQLQFSTFGDGEGEFGATDTDKMKMNAAKIAWQSSVLGSAPIDYDEATGTLTCTKENMNVMNEYYERDLADADWTLGVGDAFACTVRIDNVDEVAAGNLNIRFSDNIAPAVYSTTGTSSAAYGHVTTQDDLPAKATIQAGEDGAPLAEFSASTLYSGINDALPDASAIIEDKYAEEGDGWSDLMMNANIVCQGDSVDVSALADENAFFDIANGTFDDATGYDYAGKFIVVTFAFIITDEGPIKFALQDPQGEFDPLLDGAAYFAKKSEGQKTEDATTYAKNIFNRTTMQQDGDTEWPGSMKMTFMGKNENRGEEPPVETKYTVTFLDEKGDQISSTEYEADADVTIPPLPQNSYDETYHYTYAWNNTPSAKATADATYQVVKTSELHRYGEGVVNPEPNCTEDGLKTYTCTVCGRQYSEVVKATGHSFNAWTEIEPAVPATCIDGKTAVEKRTCSKCNTVETRGGEVIPATGEHVFSDWTEIEAAVPATCTTAGKTAVEKRTCSKCNISETRGGEVIPAAGHSLSDWAVAEEEVPATCTEPGKTAVEKRTCSNCNYFETRGGEVIPAAGHSLSDWTEAEPAVAPTKKDAGKTAVEKRTCSKCNYFETRGGEAIPALGVTITIAKSDIGTVEGLETGANKLAYGQTFTITAVPVQDSNFVGWEISGNIVSKDATYSATAASDITITPVFEDAASEEITVIFYDKYGNTVKQYKGAKEQVQSEIAAEYDDLKGPEYPSYTFVGWEKSKDELAGISASATIWAKYDKVKEEEAKKYTITTNADIILPDGIVNGQIPYDTQATVKDDTATAWMVGNAIVAYGTSYTFYVGSDVTINPVSAPVEEKATTTIVGASLVAESDYKYNIVATRNIPDGYELTDYGFVYGKNLTDADLDLDKVGQKGSNDNSGDVKAVHAGTRNLGTNEFAINYGIKNKNAPITAKSFVIVVKDDETEIVYSDMFVQNY